MNKEVKELIEQLEEYVSGGGSGLYPFEESVKALLDYINQLETNRDEAIRYIKSNPNVFYGEYLIDVETLLENECTDEIAGEIRFISTLLSILERGKE